MGAALEVRAVGEPTPVERRVGWCPGVLRPMRAGDGLLVRVKPRGQRLTFAQGRAIADAARRFGNGALTLTGRGNVQIRGVADATLEAVTAMLGEAGLLDGTPEGEAVRNVLSNALAGADPASLVDLRATVGALEQRLATDPDFWRLPAKFSWSIDDGGSLPLGDVAADIAVAATSDAPPATVVVALDGGPQRALARTADILGLCKRLADAFLALCDDHKLCPHRMRDLVAICGAETIFRRAGLSLWSGAATRRSMAAIVGLFRIQDASFVGASPAFGLLGAQTFAAFVDAAEAAAAPDIRVTPWRSLIAPDLTTAAAAHLMSALRSTDLILDAEDPRLKVSACVGQPACQRATTPVPQDASRLAALGRGMGLHVSGCAKGCADGRPAAITLVGREGRYDLVRDGRADAVPVATGLLVDELVTMLPARQEAAF